MRQPEMRQLRIGQVAVALALLGDGTLGLMGTPGACGAELAMLLRFMAVVKGGMALAVAGAAWWRLSRHFSWGLGAPARPGVALAYVAAVGGMAFGAGLVWQLAHVAWGAALVHGGLWLALGTAWADRGALLARRRTASLAIGAMPARFPWTPTESSR